MLWKKKDDKGAAATPSATKVEDLSQEKAEKKPKAEKLPGPKQTMPAPVEKYLIAEYKMDAAIARILKIVVRKRAQEGKAFDCRIFDQSDTEARGIKIVDYTSLDQHPDFILYDGWFDEQSKHVELTEKKKVNFDIPLFTEAEILQKIEALKEPGSTVFFYQARGPAVGGPLGQGSAIVELNPNYSQQKKVKKYILYTANVVDMKPVAAKQKLFDSDKPKELAKWIKDAHQKRQY